MLRGIDGVHTWTSPDGLTLRLNELDDITTGAPVWPRFRLLDVDHGYPEGGDTYHKRVGRAGAVAHPDYRGPRVHSYTIEVMGRTIDELRQGEATLRAAFYDQSAEGRMDVGTHPLNPDYDADNDRYYNAKAGPLQPGTDAPDSDLSPELGFRRDYVLGLRNHEGAYYVEPIPWTARAAAEANSWLGVAYGDGLYVAVATTGTYRVMTSPDGATWTGRTAAEANLWVSVTYGDGLFVAVSADGTNRVMTSPDGITWTARAAAEANSWRAVTYGDGLFVATADSGTHRVMTSPDGITWTARSAAEANSWWAVTHGDGLFVAASTDGTHRVMTSPDGTTWTARSAAEANSWRGVTYGNGLFVAVSTDGTNRVMTSPDGITWTARSAAEANQWVAVTYGNHQFVAVSGDGTNRSMTSPDGTTWTARAAAEANPWRAVTFGDGLFVATAQSSGTNRVMTSAYPGGADFV